MSSFETLKEKVVKALEEQRLNYTGTDKKFATKYGIDPSIYSRIKKGEREKVLDPSKWISLAAILDISADDSRWKTVRTEVFQRIEELVVGCQMAANASILVDECGIGKTHAAKYLSKTRKNITYIDCSQCKTKSEFLRTMSQALGLDKAGRIVTLKTTIKYYLNSVATQPMIILDEAGDLEYSAFLEIKELYNATEGRVGWLLMGADGLRAKIERGISGMKVGYREIFSRFRDKYISFVPVTPSEKTVYYKAMVTDILKANLADTSMLNEVFGKCYSDESTKGSGLPSLRRAQTVAMAANNQLASIQQ